MSSELKIKELKLNDKITNPIKTPNIKPEIRIGVLGNVDSGKSSTIGVITKNVLDDGKEFYDDTIMNNTNHLVCD